MSETINIRQFIKSLEPDVRGVFEPLSGIMRIGMPQSEYQAAFERYASNASTVEDVALIGTINHETYHAMQAAVSGYGFDQQRRRLAVLNSLEELPDPAADPETRSLIATLHAEAGDDPDLKRRADRAEAVLLSHRAIETMEARAEAGDYSLWGALHPGFFRYQADLAEREAAHNADGLSISGLLEGSAVAFANQLMYPGIGATAKMEAELEILTPVYRELYALTLASAGTRTMELLLPAAALALCYTEPHNAYAPMLATLAGSQPGQALAYGRKLMEAPPALPAAGAVLGTSIQLRKDDDSYRIYDKFIHGIAAGTWGIDAYAALADPDSLNRVGSFPFALVTDDNAQALKNSMDEDEMVARLMIMAIALRVAGRRRDELQIQNLQVEWARDVLSSFAESLPARDNIKP
jgi:hypothetical protein